MNVEDINLLNAERESSPVRFHTYDPNDTVSAQYLARHADLAPREEVEQPERNGSVSSEDTADDERSNRRQRPNASRTTTQSSGRMEEMVMNYLDRHPTAIKRIQDHRLQHSRTVGRTKLAVDGGELPPFGDGKPYPPPLPDKDEYVVEFDGKDDPMHPQNWPQRTKVYISAILIFDAFSTGYASAIFSAATPFVGMEFGVGQEVLELGLSLYLLGYACGPIIFAPISELYGRRLPIIGAAFAFGVFNIGVAIAKDIQTVMVCRFFVGVMGSCPLTIVAACFSDMYSNHYRGAAVATFSATVICGPLLAPSTGGFIAKSYLGWRFTAYIPAFLGFAAATLALLFQKETYGPVILVGKAADLRRRTHNWGIRARQEEIEVNFKELVSQNLSRPLRILFTEPIVLYVTLFSSFLYLILYGTLTAFQLVFAGVHGFSPGVDGLPYFGVLVGAMLGFVLVLLDVPRYAKRLSANDDIPVPEWRLPLMMIGSIAFAIGLFFFGWSGQYQNVHWVVPTIAGGFIGFGIYLAFLQSLNYIIDAYLAFAASAIAANTIMRSVLAAAFPLFASYMFEGIGINWGMTLLGCIAVLFIPAPFLFYKFGKRIRAKSKFAPAPDVEKDKKENGEGSGDEEAGNGKSNENEKKKDSRDPSEDEEKKQEDHE